MFKRKTLFILGAGASFYYNYPIGKELVSDIIFNIEHDSVYVPLGGNTNEWHKNYNSYSLKMFFELWKQGQLLFPPGWENKFPNSGIGFAYWKESGLAEMKLANIDELQKLYSRLKDFSPISIDAFLRDNPQFIQAGNLMIAYSLLKRENKIFFQHAEEKARNKVQSGEKESHKSDHWYSHLFNDITAGCSEPQDILGNQLNIITFNYDVSLEYYLMWRLKETEFFKDVAEKFINELLGKRIHHVYGKLYENNNLQYYGDHLQEYANPHLGDNYIEKNQYLPNPLRENVSAFSTAVKNYDLIKTMRHEKSADEKYKEILEKAEEIIIIGFSFDRDNLTKIGFPLDINGYKALKGKTIKYLDYGGKMNSLYSQFQAIQAQHNKKLSINIIRSPATSIIDAYENDFKLRLF